MSVRTYTIVTAGLLLLIAATGGGVAQAGEIDAVGSPELTAYTPGGDLTPGSEETLTVQIGNAGDLKRGSAADRQFVTTARDVAVELDASGTPITVDTGRQTIGELPETKTGTPEFDLIVPSTATPGRYTLDVNIEYSYTSKVRNAPGLRPSSSEDSDSVTRTITVRVTDDPRFEVSEIDSSLRVGEEGEITGRLRNIGADDAQSVEVRFAPESDTVTATTNRVAVDDIPAGESARFSIPVEVTTEAKAVPREFDLPVTYRNADTGIRGEDDDPSFRVDIAESRDTFIVEPVNPTVAAGSTKSLDLRVTNNRDETLEDIEGKLFVDDPLDSANDETFTTALEPNETTTVTVDLSASEGATIKSYPVSMDFRYTDSDGDSKLTDSYRLSIDVTEPSDDGGGLPLGPLLIGLVVIGGVGGVLWRRRNSETTDVSGLDNE